MSDTHSSMDESDDNDPLNEMNEGQRLELVASQLISELLSEDFEEGISDDDELIAA